MVPSPGMTAAKMATVLTEPLPQGRGRAAGERMSADTNYPRPPICPDLARLEEEVHAPLRPVLPTIAICQHPRAAKALVQFIEQVVEVVEHCHVVASQSGRCA